MKISVCIATYNGERFIKEQIVSILCQLKPEDELIISDDKSTDATKKIINKINDSRIKFYVNKGERGYTRNFENALKKSTGDIIFLSDQDDIWLENKVEIMLKELEESQMVVSDAKVVNSELEIIHNSHFDLYNVKTGFWNNFLKTRYIGACMAFKRELLNKALPFPKHQKYCAHDYWLTLIGEALFDVNLIKSPLLLYRRHDNNASSGGKYSSNSLLHKIIVRFYCFINLIYKYFTN